MSEDKKDKKKAIDSVLKQIEKDHGKFVLFKDMSSIPRINTGSLKLDAALGGGFPVGKIIELYGWQSSGKTTLALLCAKELQTKDPEALIVFIDAEHAFDSDYAEMLGLNMDPSVFFLIKPDHGDQALAIMDSFVDSGEISLIIVDSVAALVPKSEVEGDFGDSNMGKHAKLMSQACRKLTPKLSRQGTTAIFINQIREKIGVLYGSPETTTGGNGLKFYSSVRINLRASMALKEGKEVYGNTIKAKIAKTKISKPGLDVEFNLIHGKGIDQAAERIDLAIDAEVIEQRGSFFYYKGTNLAQGKTALGVVLSDNPELWDEIQKDINSK